MFWGAVWLASSLFAQSYTMKTVAGTSRLQDGSPATSVPLRSPYGVAQDATGNVYVADSRDNRVRRVGLDGNITTIAGTGVAGFSGDIGPATKAKLDSPRAIRLDGKGNLYIADYYNSRVRKVALSTGVITTVAGSGDFRAAGDNGPARQAGLDTDDIAVDGDGNLYIADFFNNRIRKVTAADGNIKTIGGIGIAGDAGDTGKAVQAALDGPTGISVDAQGMVYFADYYNNRVRKIDQKSGMITTVAGTGDLGNSGNEGPATNATLLIPLSTSVEPDGNLLILTVFFLRRVTIADGNIHAVAGNTSIGFAGDGGGVAGAQFAVPRYVSAAANADILLADSGNYRVRRIHAGILSTVAGTTISDNIPAASAFLNQPAQALPDGKGGFLIADTSDHRVRAVGGNGTIANVLGTGVPGDTLLQLDDPLGIALGAQGAVYIADSRNDRILFLPSGGNASVVAGGIGSGFSGDNGAAVRAMLSAPSAVAVDAAGVVYIADTGNFRVRMINDGTITTLAGTGSPGFGGDNGPADKARLSAVDVAVDNAGNLYIADTFNHRIRKVNLSTKTITTVAGIGTPGYTGDGGPATSAQLQAPTGIAIDAAGNLYIADRGNSVVRRVSGGMIKTIAGTGNSNLDLESGPATGVSIDAARVAVDRDGTIYIADPFNDRVRKLAVAVPASLAIASGDGQSGAPGKKLVIAVKVTDAARIPVAAVTVNLAVTSGSAVLDASAIQTGADGTATTKVTLGSTVGPVKITASSAGLSSVTFNLTVTQPPVTTPVPVIDGGVAGAALSVPAVRALSTGGIASVFGKNFGAATTFQNVAQDDLLNGRVSVNFRSVCVDVAGVRAPVFGVSDGQVNFQVPVVGSGGTAAVRVIAACGTPTEVASDALSVATQAATPEFFYFAHNPDGHNPVAATDSITGVAIAAADLFPGSGFAPAHPKQFVTIYATGFGATSPSFAPGEFPGTLASVTSDVRVQLNGHELPAANVLYAGVTPFSPGLYQLNVLLPDDTPDGDLALVIQIGGLQSPAGAFLTVRGNQN